MPARMSDSQKLKQKSQSNNCEISLGALAIIKSRIPSFPINKIMKAAKHAIISVLLVIKYISDIALLLLM